MMKIAVFLPSQYTFGQLKGWEISSLYERLEDCVYEDSSSPLPVYKFCSSGQTIEKCDGCMYWCVCDGEGGRAGGGGRGDRYELGPKDYKHREKDDVKLAFDM